MSGGSGAGGGDGRIASTALRTGSVDPWAEKPLIIAATREIAAKLAGVLGIAYAHVRSPSQTAGRGCSASAVLVDNSAWPLSDEDLAALIPVGPVIQLRTVETAQRAKADLAAAADAIADWINGVPCEDPAAIRAVLNRLEDYA